MRDPLPSIQHIAIATHPSLPEAKKLSLEIDQFLSKHGVDADICSGLYDDTLRQRMADNQYDLLVAVGGDGTMLRAGHLCAPLNLPILGVNMGHFGFLTETDGTAWQETLLNLLDRKYWLEEHMMLQAEHRRDGELLDSWTLLNEVVVCRGQFVRPINIQASVDGYLLSTYVADGLIAATPTGSTAYALAVGGPIMPPELRNILIIPVAPHLSVDRAIILAEGARVTISVQSSHQAVLSADGQSPITMLNDDTVHVEAGDHVALFVRLHDPGYFYRNLTMHMHRNPSTGHKT
jgi:NAD+ kinase